MRQHLTYVLIFMTTWGYGQIDSTRLYAFFQNQKTYKKVTTFQLSKNACGSDNMDLNSLRQPFFCRLEDKWESKGKTGLKFRLGNFDTAEYLEGKSSALINP